MRHEKLNGFIAAPFTCFNEDSSVNLKPIKAYADFLTRNGTNGVFILGTTGESMSITTSERKSIAEEWIKYAAPDFKIIVHVGSSSLKTSQELAAHAQGIGAYAVGCIAPNFYKPATVEDLVAYTSAVAKACPSLPFYYYHIPSMSGVYLSMPEFLRQAGAVIPNLNGIKFTHNDLMEFNQCLMADNGRYDILHGFDETLLCGLVLGVQAAIGSTYNYFQPVYLKLREAFLAGDLDTARKMQQLSVRLVSILIKYRGGIACGKAIMNLIGIPCGPCRLPIRSLNTTEINNLRQDLEQMNFFELISLASVNSDPGAN
ncbi:MAG: dihydrodipicolinate synthase family protein [Lewinella sp.]|nr:dihydrodipicolinate synthase family protein [Lewinella sp.]